MNIDLERNPVNLLLLTLTINILQLYKYHYIKDMRKLYTYFGWRIEKNKEHGVSLSTHGG